MAKKNEKIPTSRPALDVGAEIIGAMNEEFHNAPDRVLAVVGAAYLDSLLEELFRAVFIGDRNEADSLLAPDRALGSNGSRYQLAYCLGLINKEQRDDLKMIAKIRNAFAHRYDVRSFDDDEAKSLLARLHYGKELDSIVEMLVQKTTDPEQRNYLRNALSDRRKFQDTVRNLFMILLRKLNSVCRADTLTWYCANPG
jgi:DNA-binding MltR family transcriptional regulator